MNDDPICVKIPSAPTPKRLLTSKRCFKSFNKEKAVFSKICSSLKLLNALKGFLFKRISSPVQSARITNMVLDIKNVFEKENDLSNNISKTLDLIVGFKKENPQDFDELFQILKDLIQEYEKNPEEVKQNLTEILK